MSPSESVVTVTAKGAARLRAGHPWVYAADIAHDGAAGADIVRVVDGRGALLGTALWAPGAQLPLRLVARTAVTIDAALLEARIRSADELRRRLMPQADAYRVVHAEADGLPGLIVDRYGDVCVLQTGARAMDAREDEIARIVQAVTGARLVVARDDSSARDFEGLPRRRAVLRGDGPTLVRYHDAGNLYEVDVLADGKTGGFLDQAENHARAAEYARGDCLDAFTYHGGFALALARGGATSVLAIDEAAPAVARATANAERNQLKQVTVEQGNAFDRLRQLEGDGRRFDVVVIDPPALAKRKSAYGAAERAYKELNLRGIRLCSDGGILVTCSCSGKMTPERFGAVVEDAARDAGRRVQLIERRGAGRDHPPLLGVPETEYLKCWILRDLTTTARARFDDFWQALSAERQIELARDYAARARADGAYVVLADGGETPIPPIVTPAAIDRARMAAVSTDAHDITRGLTKLTADLMEDHTRAPLKQRLFGAFGPLEQEALGATWRKAEQLATVRVDFLVDVDGHARALEVNSTIPAMQGYSDAIAAAFLAAVGRARGLSEGAIAALIDDNGRNSDDLLVSLLAHHERLGGRDGAQSIAIVARAGDAQYGELQHYVRRWSARGHRVFIATPETVRIVDGRAVVDGVIPDVIYRHIFARRLDPASDFARLCLEPERFHVFNPISSHLEVKGMLGLLSAAAGDDAESARIGLDDTERGAVARAVPWTRLYAHGPTRGPDGALIPDLAAWTRDNGAALVLKRSWDYGGKGVFLGAELAAAESAQARLAPLLGRPAGHVVGWHELCDFALADRDAWVVQELVASPTERHLRVDGGELHARDLYVDLSAFTNSGDAPRPAGGAVRASESRIVNILGGGGLAPLVKDDVLSKLLG